MPKTSRSKNNTPYAHQFESMKKHLADFMKIAEEIGIEGWEVPVSQHSGSGDFTCAISDVMDGLDNALKEMMENKRGA